jgi:hypothetical protein
VSSARSSLLINTLFFFKLYPHNGWQTCTDFQYKNLKLLETTNLHLTAILFEKRRDAGSMNGNMVPVTNFFCSLTSRVSSNSYIFLSSGFSQRIPQRGRKMWNVKIQKYKRQVYILPRLHKDHHPLRALPLCRENAAHSFHSFWERQAHFHVYSSETKHQQNKRHVLSGRVPGNWYSKSYL